MSTLTIFPGTKNFVLLRDTSEKNIQNYAKTFSLQEVSCLQLNKKKMMSHMEKASFKADAKITSTNLE